MTNDLIIGAAPPARAGSAAGICAVASVGLAVVVVPRSVEFEPVRKLRRTWRVLEADEEVCCQRLAGGSGLTVRGLATEGPPSKSALEAEA